MKKLKAGVIGTGIMGKNHVRVLSGDEKFELIGVFDKDFNLAQTVAAKYGTYAFIELEELLDRVDIVIIAVPSVLHKEIGLIAAAHNVHALIEKPLAISTVDAKELVDTFLRNGLKLAVGHIERFNPVIQELQKLIDNKKVFYIEAHRYSSFSGSGRILDVSVIEDLMIHDIDLVCSLMEPFKVINIHGSGECVKSNNIDFASCILDFNTNTHAVINASRISQDKERYISIHTENDCIYADLLLKTLTVSQNVDMEIDGAHDGVYRQNGIMQKIFVPLNEPLKQEITAFYNAVVKDEPIPITGKIGIRAIQICEKVKQLVDISNNRRFN